MTTAHTGSAHARQRNVRQRVIGVDGPRAAATRLRSTGSSPVQTGTSPPYVQVVMARPNPDSGAVRWPRTAALRRNGLCRSVRRTSPHECWPFKPGPWLRGSTISPPGGTPTCRYRRISRGRYERMLVRDDTRAVLDNPPCPLADGAAGIRAPAVGPQQDRCRIRRLAGKRTGPCIGARARARAWRPGLGVQAVPEPLRVRDAWDPQPEIDEASRRPASGWPSWAISIPTRLGRRRGRGARAVRRVGRSPGRRVARVPPIDRLRSGSTAQRLADDAPCPLLVLSSMCFH